MTIMQTYAWTQEALGEHLEFPGHPLVLATMIMDRYHSFDHARARPEGAQFYNAISDSFVPGAGCAVSSAMSVLKLALERGIDDAVAEADRYWQGWEAQRPGNERRGVAGREQALRIQPLFQERLKAWKAGTPAASPYRLAADAQLSPDIAYGAD